MKQSMVLSIFPVLLLLSSSFVTPIHGRHNSHAPTPSSPLASPAPAPAPSDNSDCSTIIYDMADCLSFLSAGSTDLTPTKSCCDGFGAVLDYNPQCICVALVSSRELGLELNDTRSAAMPSLCKISITPPNCDASAPAVSPVAPSSPPSGNPPTASEEPTPETKPTAAAPAPSGAGTSSVSVLLLVVAIISSFSYIPA